MKKSINTEEDYWVFSHAKFFFFLVVEMPLWSLNTQINVKNMHSMQCYLHRIPIISSFSVLHISFWFWLVLCFVELALLQIQWMTCLFSWFSLSLSSSHTYKHTQVGLLNLENEDFVKQMVEATQANFQVSIPGLNRLWLYQFSLKCPW